MKDNLYIIRVYNKAGESMIKLGYSSNIEERLKTYYYHNPMMELIGTFYVENALVLEKEIHSKFKSIYLNEWYSEADLDSFLKIVRENQKDLIKNQNNPTVSINRYFDEDVFKQVISALTSEEFYIFFKLIQHSKNNIVISFNDSLSDRKLGEYLNLDRRKPRAIIDKLKELNYIKTYNGFWAINPTIINYGYNVNKELLEVFKK